MLTDGDCYNRLTTMPDGKALVEDGVAGLARGHTFIMVDQASSSSSSQVDVRLDA